MKGRKLRRIGGRWGFTLVEVMVALVILATALLSLAAAAGLAVRQLYYSQTDTEWWTAVQLQLEELSSQGFQNVADGSATVEGYPMSWTVSGPDPKTVTVEVTRTRRNGQVVVDTLLLIMPSADTL